MKDVPSGVDVAVGSGVVVDVDVEIGSEVAVVGIIVGSGVAVTTTMIVSGVGVAQLTKSSIKIKAKMASFFIADSSHLR